jgi:serine protease Do
MMKIYEAIRWESDKIYVMKPAKFRNYRFILLPGVILAFVVFAFAQGTPPLPSQTPAGLVPPVTRPPGPPLGPAPCAPNRLTAIEQLQSGVSMSDILQQENRAVSCKVDPAVVEVSASGFGAMPGQEYDTPASAAPGPTNGSGVIISADGYIITNRHVIKNAPKVTVILHATGKQDEAIQATLVGQDETTDLAVLKVAKTGLPFLDFNFVPVRQGDTVFAFGSPHGYRISMTKGVVSAPVRQVREEDEIDYIQTDAPINPGNSGGALVDINGKLVGINTFIFSSSGGNEGINFALPADVVFQVYSQIKQNGYVVRGTIGISTRNLTPEMIRALKLDVDSGVYIEDVEPKGPADIAGIQVGDIVVGYDNKPLQVDLRRPDPALDLRRNITRQLKNAKIQLDIVRRGVRKTFDVEVKQASGERSADSLQLSSDFLIEQLGVYGLKMTMNLAASRNLRNRQGVVVAAKVQSMQSDSWNLQFDDLIFQVNGEPVAELDDLRKALDEAESGSTVFLNIERNRKIILVPITIK